MVSKEIKQKVYEFIKKHPNLTKNQVVKGMENQYSRLTVLAAIDELLSKEKTGALIKYSKDKPRGFYHLYVDNKNEFDVLEEKIKLTYRQFTSLTKDVTPNSFSVKDEDFRNLIVLFQLGMYSVVTGIAARIKKIEPSENRETLYLDMIQLLDISHELNIIIAPAFVSNMKRLATRYENECGDKKLADDFKNEYEKFEGLMQKVTTLLNPESEPS